MRLYLLGDLGSLSLCRAIGFLWAVMETLSLLRFSCLHLR
jgi:hypothetical protein